MLLTGQFRPDRRCLVEIEIVNAIGTFRAVHAKLDTGFDGDIALPKTDFDALDVSPTRTTSVSLADRRNRKIHNFMHDQSASNRD